MQFHHLDGVKRQKRLPRWIVPVVALAAFIAGAYILVVTYAPQIEVFNTDSPERVANLVKETKPGDNGDRLYIPQINIDVAVVEGTDPAVLDKGAWHRATASGNPAEGGNFVLSAHRFAMGLTPQQTRAKSPFYHIDKLTEGDQFFVDYKQKRYAYKVSKRYQVERTAVEIEAPSDEDKLTLYSCDLRGEKAGRFVIEAKPEGEVVGMKVVPTESSMQ